MWERVGVRGTSTCDRIYPPSLLVDRDLCTGKGINLLGQAIGYTHRHHSTADRNSSRPLPAQSSGSSYGSGDLGKSFFWSTPWCFKNPCRDWVDSTHVPRRLGSGLARAEKNAKTFFFHECLGICFDCGECCDHHTGVCRSLVRSLSNERGHVRLKLWNFNLLLQRKKDP